MTIGMSNKHFQSFHTPPPLDREQLSFCETNIEAFSSWALSLSLLQLGDRAAAILNALNELSSLNCSESLRFDMLQELHLFVEHVLETIDKNFLSQNARHAERQNHLIDLNMQIRLSLIQLYIDIVFRSPKPKHSQWKIWQYQDQHDSKICRILSCYYALQNIGCLLLQQQLNYVEVLLDQWRYTHEIYQYAFKNNEHLININRIQGSDYPLTNIQECYIQILILDICYTYQIRPSEIQALYECSSEWVQLVELSHRSSHTSRYMIDSQQDLPPIFNHKQQQFFLADHYLSTHKLLEHINNTIQDQPQYLSEKERKYLCASLKFHIQNVLGATNIVRKHQRYQHSAELEISLSLEAAHYQLSQKNQYIQTAPANSNLNATSATRSLMCEVYLSATQPQGDTILKTADAKLNQDITQIYTTQVLDMSSHGYRIQWDAEIPKNLHSSELVIVREKNDLNWKVGVIRWMKKSYQNNFAIGLEVLSEHVFPCNVHPQRPANTATTLSGLLFAQTYTGKIQLSIVLPNLPDLSKFDCFFLELRELKIQLVRKKTLMVTQSFVQFEIESQHARQLPILREILDRLIAQL